MGIDGSIAGWAFLLLFVIAGLRIAQGIVTLGLLRDEHLKDPLKRGYWTKTANSPLYSEAGRRWHRANTWFHVRSILLLGICFVVLDLVS